MDKSQIPQDVLDIINSKESGGGNRYSDGRYLLEVVEFVKKQGEKGTSYRASFLVREAAPADYSQPVGKHKQPPVGAPSPVGSQFDSVWNVTTTKSAKANVRAFIRNLFNAAADVGELELAEALMMAYSPGNPCRGMLVRGSTYRSEIKGGDNQGKDYVGMNFYGIEQSQEDILARRNAQLAQPATAAQPTKSTQDPSAAVAAAVSST